MTLMHLHIGLLSIFILTTVPVALFAQELEGQSNVVMADFGGAPSPEKVTLETLGITNVPKYYALILAVSDYQHTGPKLPDLEMPTKDGERLASLLMDKYTFDADAVILLKNPTREDIINQFDQLAEKITEKDNLLIFYAGHGVYDKSKDFGYWLPSDAKIESRSAWIANSTVKDYIGAIKSKHTLLITDACFGGSIFKTRSVSVSVLRFSELYRSSSRKAITSGNLTEVPDESVFIKFLIKNLEEFEEVFFPASLLFNRMYEPILNNTTTIPQFGVIQGSGDEGGEFIFIKKK